jgi:hypothetical protein
LFDYLLDPFLPNLIISLGRFARAFVEWVAPLIPPLLLELGKIALKIVGFLVTDALPAILKALGKVALAFVEWVGPLIPPLLVELLKLDAKLLGFVAGLPLSLAKSFGRLALSFVEWVGPAIGDLLVALGKLEVRLLGFAAGLPGKIASKIGGAIDGAFDGIKNAFRSALNWIIRAWNRLEFKIPGFDPPGPGPSFGGFTLGVPNIPELRDGGIVPATPGGRLVRVAEGGSDEAVIPLKSGMKNLGRTTTVNVYPQTANIDERDLANILRRTEMLYG